MRKFTLLLLFAAIGTHALPAAADNSYRDLALFKAGTFSRGLWHMEILSSNDPRMMQGNALANNLTNNKMGICMDAAEDLDKHAERESSAEKCSVKILRNTGDVAEVARTCAKSSSHTVITRESGKSFVIDNQMTTETGKNIQMKMRYSYQGACKSTDSVVQMDKNSEACKKMGNMDMTKMAGMCAKLQPEARAQCEQQIKSMAGMCQ